MLKKLENSLNSPRAVLFALLLALIVQASHTVEIYLIEEGNPTIKDYIMGIFIASTLSLSILLHTLRKKILVAYLYLAFELSINLMYYNIGEIQVKQTIRRVAISLFLPITIARYSYLMKEAKDLESKEVEESKSQKVLSDLQNQLELTKAELQALTEKTNVTQYEMQMRDKKYVVDLKPVNKDDV